MIKVTLTEALRRTYPGFKFAYFSAKGVDSESSSESLDRELKILCSYVASNSDALIKHTDVMASFFFRISPKSRYHIRSLLQKLIDNKPIKRNSTAVDIVYIAEMRHAELMGLFDESGVSGQLELDVAVEGETIDHISGRVLPITTGDVVMRNRNTIIASLTGGPDKSTCVTHDTKSALVVAFGAPGTECDHLMAAMSCAAELFKLTQNAEIGGIELLTA